jgi:hypothetical protein
MTKWGTKIEREIHRRIKVSIYAYAYEVEDESLVSDAEYDKLSSEINPKIKTGDEFLDDFFADELEGFSPHTGQWIHDHPELPKIKKLYEKHFKL